MQECHYYVLGIMEFKINMDKNIIINSLKQTVKEFNKNELAFLALTTKIELPLRDRWAYVLFNKLSKTDFFVSREWKRTDIAIIKKSKPAVLIEIKALYTFDAISVRGNYKKRISYLQDDELKASKLALKDTQVYTVLFATHPLSIVPNKLEGIVKYVPGINMAFRKHENAHKIKKKAVGRIKKEFKGKNLIAEGVLKAGSAFGIETEILYWILHK
jgi:hypothetical protein